MIIVPFRHLVVNANDQVKIGLFKSVLYPSYFTRDDIQPLRGNDQSIVRLSSRVLAFSRT